MLKVRPLQKLRLATMLGIAILGFAMQGCSGDKAKKVPSEKTVKTDSPPPGIAAPIERTDPIAPPKDAFGGNGRVINLAMKDGVPVTVDLWAMPSTLYTQVKLVENLAFGETSEWFQSPKGSPIRAFLTGTEPSPEGALTGVSYARKGTHVTGMMLNRENGTIKTRSTWDTAINPEELMTPDAPPEGKGFVLLRADQLRLHEKAMVNMTGGGAFQVGDGKKSCIRQRVEDMGHPPSLLGGTQPVKLDLDPGKNTISFHKSGAEGCTKDGKVYEVQLDVKAGEAQVVVLFTPDMQTIKNIILPTPVNAAKPYGTNKELRAKQSAKRAARKVKKAAERAEKEATEAAKAKP